MALAVTFEVTYAAVGYAVRYVGNDVRYSGHSGTNEHLRNDDYEGRRCAHRP